MTDDQPRTPLSRQDLRPTDREIEIRLRVLECASRLLCHQDAPAGLVSEQAIRVAAYLEHFVYEGLLFDDTGGPDDTLDGYHGR